MTLLLSLALSSLLSGPAEQILSSLPEAPLHTRLEAASHALLGRPYLLGPMGEGDAALGDSKPRIRLDSLDCVTFIEQSEALARSRSEVSFSSILDSIRYRDGKVAWGNRNHYMECGWFSSNASRVRLLELPGSIHETRLLELHKFYASHGVERRDSSLTLAYLPREKAIAWLSDPRNAPRIRGIGFVGKTPHIFLHHTGFLVPSEGAAHPLLRHASESGSVRQEPAAAYLQRKKLFLGIVVWEYLPLP
jgi:D-alanyl-D-alanine carboxypeptidase/D-alanyl-D-alanine-endopeptidase (penicillin-binding protein 4)